MSYRELQKSRLPAFPNHFKEKERRGTNCGQNTHVALNWLEQLKSSVGCFTSTSLAQDSNDHNRAWSRKHGKVNIVQNWSCKRDVAMSSSLRLPTCHVQSLLRSTFALGQSKHSQQSPHGVFRDALLCPDIWSPVLSRTPGDRSLSSCHGVLEPQRRTVDVSNSSAPRLEHNPLHAELSRYQFCLDIQ